jgi:hypothetical protein
MKAPTTPDDSSLRNLLLNQSARSSPPPSLAHLRDQGSIDSPDTHRASTMTCDDGATTAAAGPYHSSTRAASAAQAARSREALLRVLTSALELIEEDDMDGLDENGFM